MNLAAALPSPLVRPFTALTEPSLPELFDRFGVTMVYGAQEEIYAQEDAPDLVYRVLSGAVCAPRLLGDGRRQVGGFYYKGDLFGLETGTSHRASAEALTETKVVAVRRSALHHYGALGERLERLLWRATGEELSQVRDHMLLLARKNAVERVAGFLDDIAQRLGGDWIELPMSRQEIADYVGLTIETVSRMITQLQAQQVVQFDGCRRFRISAPGRMAALIAA